MMDGKCLMISVLVGIQIINYHIRNEKLFEEMAAVLLLEFSRLVTIKEVIILTTQIRFRRRHCLFCLVVAEVGISPLENREKKANDQWEKKRKKYNIITIVFITVLKIVLVEYSFFVVFVHADLSSSVSFA